MSSSHTPPAPYRRARAATAVLFLTNGALFANLLPRYPEIKDSLGLSDGVFGIAVAAFPAGAILFGLLAARLVRAFGSGLIAAVFTALVAVGLLGASLAPSLWVLMLCLLIAGGADAVADVSQNEHALRVQAGYHRSIINSLHAVWSLGGVLGGVMAAGAVGLTLPLPVHLSLSGAMFTLAAVGAWWWMLPRQHTGTAPGQVSVESHPTPGKRCRLPIRWSSLGFLLVLVLIGNTGTMVEDVGNSWAALYLFEERGTSPIVATMGFTTLITGQLMGRLVADPLIDRFGLRPILSLGGALIGLGLGVALLFPSVWGTILGVGIAGYGSAALVPGAYDQAHRIPGLPEGTGLTLVSWLMRIGFLITPPVVGALAEVSELRWALLVVPAAGMLTMWLARWIPDTQTAGARA
ncbi:MFS transporter [Auritidibacter ignavus]|uniref:MFS transporter n=1 Tax=Auritidibacter ignavus TaxID=678932 RepID=UPI00244A332B|nr:MFS transporter [Auritidibacter ignavus]WGH86510.1 MFS transporter [Auritidibacter ignavus]WGH88795.1 MFS transporter [Auritidibacter ignavus]